MGDGGRTERQTQISNHINYLNVLPDTQYYSTINPMKPPPSGKFVLRLPQELHARLQREARRANESLNQTCANLIITGLSQKGSEPALLRPVPPTLVQGIQREWKSNLLGILLFGSAARGETTQSSDVDLLIVFKQSAPIRRELYQTWDQLLARLQLGKPNLYSPQFVSLPEDFRKAGGLWLEVALDGIILWEQDVQISHFFGRIRTMIAEGTVKRKLTHGHPYWEHKEGVA